MFVAAGSICGDLNELQANKFDALFGFEAFSLKIDSDGFFNAFCKFIKRFGLGVTASQIWDWSNVNAILVFFNYDFKLQNRSQYRIS